MHSRTPVVDPAAPTTAPTAAATAAPAPAADGTGRSEAVVELAGVRRMFGPATGLADLTLSVPAGSVTVLVGPNGAGKTTALRVITGALTTEAGTARVFGLDPAGPDGEQVRRRCGVVAAKPALYDRLTGRDNLAFAAELFGLGRHAPVEDAAARFGIHEALDLRVGGYSTGMKTRLALARAVLHDPDLLLLDEPTSGLDPESAYAVLALVDGMAADGKTVVMCTHLLLEAEGLADEVVMMEDGLAVLAGPPEELVRRFWPHPLVVFRAEDGATLDRLQLMEGVVRYARTGDRAEVEVDDRGRVPHLVASLAAVGVRLTQVTPHEPSLEELYLRVRQR
ncbi:MAG: type transport system ATP-binding protein [Actinomycetota bacterium]|nr:type transport system ATP-binding protein [Actinomycetota bacterium]